MSDSYPPASAAPASGGAAFAPTNPWAVPPGGSDGGSVGGPGGLGGSGGEGGQRPVVLVVLIAVTVVILGVVAWLLIGSGGDPASEAAPAPPPAAPAPSPTPSARPSPEETLPDTFEGVAGTDPFRPLVAPAAPASAATATTTTSGGDSTATGTGESLPPLSTWPYDDGTDTGTTGSGSGSSSSGDAGTSTPSPTPASVHLALTDVTTDNTAATFAVDGQLERVLVGDEFAESFRLLRLEGGQCATVQYGDEGVDLCEGDQLQL